MALSVVTTIQSPAGNRDLTDLATVKDELDIAADDESSDTFLKRAISEASAIAARFCNRVSPRNTFAVETVQDIIYPERDAYPYQVPGQLDTLQLSHWPIVGIDSLTVVDPPGTATVLVDGIDYKLMAESGQLVRLSKTLLYPTTWDPSMTTVVYEAGYQPIPFDVALAVLRMVTYRFYLRGRDPAERQINIPGVVERQYGPAATGSNIPPDIAQLLLPYRVPVTA
jgi:hypothetical protein